MYPECYLIDCGEHVLFLSDTFVFQGKIDQIKFRA